MLLLLGIAPAGAASTADNDARGGTGTAHGTGAHIDFTSWQGPADWNSGAATGLTVLPGRHTGMIMTHRAGTRDVTDAAGETASWEYATWTSPVAELDFGATELVASWAASTPGRSWVSVEVQGHYTDGTTTPWYVLGQWSDDDAVPRSSVEGQTDGRSEILTDTLVVTAPGTGDSTADTDDAADADDSRLTGYRLRATTYRQPGSLVMPRVWMIGAMASRVPARTEVEPSAGGIAWGEQLAVPQRSKNIHPAELEEFGGGPDWSSPAAVTMVLEYFGVVPARADMAWIEPGYTDPQVAHAAKMTWDHAFRGTGNWSFNTAYASSFPELEAFVTRLHSLDDVERLIDAGIPVVTSQSFREGELDGAGYATSGHLMVVTGFTENGDVIVNDPAARSNVSVRRVYDREQFEKVWLRTVRPLADGELGSGSGGVVYIIKPHHLDLPDVERATW
ncbi:peptidase C39 family protein [Phytoactinopolyspora alkaliphila]|uniref:Peptidase C39 family protein n=2 Tax=Phytoactinopolyspora alkaliphila TaxID=1783498 RepID=A0A6N9YT85_9ACTN|nr:peptidase C39 family protein [Phytoactinopolyspora alkaliphila]